jgi:hypothetical protein
MLHIEFPTFFRTLCTFVPPQVIYDPQSHVKALFAWSGDTVVVSFRGSAAPLNWLMDALVGGVVGGGWGGVRARVPDRGKSCECEPSVCNCKRKVANGRHQRVFVACQGPAHTP